MNGLSLIIPALNEEEGLRHVLGALEGLRPTLSIPVEVIVVDDGSSDRTAEVASTARAVVIKNPVNLGYGASLKRGLSHATHEWIGIIDADGSYDVGELGKLLACADAYDTVIGARQGKVYRGTFLKYPMRVVFHWLCTYVTGVKVPDVNSGFRLFRKELALQHARVLCQGFSFTTSLTMLCLLEGKLVGFVPITYSQRVGTSKVRLFRDTLRSSQILLEVVLLYNPLKAFLVFGLVPFAIGLCALTRAPWLAAVMTGIAFLIWSLGGIAVLLSRRNHS